MTSIMQVGSIFEFLVLLAVAHGAPVLAKKLLGQSFSYPLDGGRDFIDGRPLFGASKTVRGVVASIFGTIILALALGLAWPIGLLIGLTAVIGDLITSFIKRRMGYPPSSRVLGLDQIPESLFPALVAKSTFALTMIDILLIVVLFTIGHLILSWLLFKMNIRDEPY